MEEVTVTFGEAYGPLPTSKRARIPFLGWFSEEGVPIVNGTLVRTAKDHTLHAEWMEITSEKVEIVFVKDNITKKDVRTL